MSQSIKKVHQKEPKRVRDVFYYKNPSEKVRLKEFAEKRGFSSSASFLKFLSKSTNTLDRIDKFLKLMKAFEDFRASLYD